MTTDLTTTDVATTTAVPTATARTVRVLTNDELARALAVPDYTDPAHGTHAVGLVLGEIVAAVRSDGHPVVEVHRADPVTEVADNYDALGIGPDAVTRDARYTRYVSADTVLCTHATALVPPALRGLAAGGGVSTDTLLVCPAVVYRRDSVDRLHSATPHQLDLWRLRPTGDVAYDVVALERLAAMIVEVVAPGADWRSVPTSHPYTTNGRQIDVHATDDAGIGAWVEIGECGLAAPHVLARAGLDPDRVTGLALGMGLDRAVMVRKRIDDIRLIRSTDPRVLVQLADLERYRPVSACPSMIRELSIAAAEAPDDEQLGDRVREVVGDDAELIEAVAVVAVTPIRDLPPAAVERLGASPDQVNVLVRVVLRRLDRALTRTEANRVRDTIAAAIHEGARPV
jgi:phenylalanyl-tRNA synthetase alpha chain